MLRQGEELRRALAEKMQMHYQVLLEATTGLVAQRLREKETDVQKAVRHNAKLEAREVQLNSEVQTWQERAREHETTTVALRSQLQAGYYWVIEMIFRWWVVT
ncbi:SBP (S-ribonuclease binding protein) family protein [Abeliophyllum distichum]|uniref:SBP (S-ribonuclease binding protein) family protein n=1 Tax=Abeliophyllum distichum TaxID=126358 RepID=A0ABD1QI25_9LAMI